MLTPDHFGTTAETILTNRQGKKAKETWIVTYGGEIQVNARKIQTNGGYGRPKMTAKRIQSHLHRSDEQGRTKNKSATSQKDI